MIPIRNTLSFQTTAVIVILVMSWGTDVIHADADDVLCDLSLAEEEELTSAAWQLNNDNNVQHTDLSRDSRFGSGGSGSRGGAENSLDVCSEFYRGPAVNQRSSCPWHYVEEELPAGSSPPTLLKANLTCGGLCLMVNPTTGQKVPSTYHCLAVRRTVAVLRCSVRSPRNGFQRCCRTELRSVTVAFTCAFPN